MTKSELVAFIESAKITKQKAIAFGLSAETLIDMTETIKMLQTKLNNMTGE